MKQWVKTSPYGDYRDNNQNHKVGKDTTVQHLVNRARNNGISHPGSKTIGQLKARSFKCIGVMFAH